MPDIDSIFAYEFDFEEAAAKVIEAGGIAVNLNLVNTKKKAPFVDSISYLAAPTGTRINWKGQKLWHVFKGTFTTRFVVVQNDSECRAQLKLLVGRHRLMCQLFNQSFNESPHLPHHFISEMLESTPGRGHNADQKHDWFELRHIVTLSIRPSAFVG
jgi:hypothetical protein